MKEVREPEIGLGVVKGQIMKRLGVEKFKKYFYCLNCFLSRKLKKSEFDKLCIRVLGKENIVLHNKLICTVLKNAQSPPINHLPHGGQKQTVESDERRIEIVEDGEEVINPRSQLLSFGSNSKGTCRICRHVSISSSGSLTSFESGFLCDTESLKKRMEGTVVANGIEGVSTDCANTMNNMLDLYLKRLIRSSIQRIQGYPINGMRRPVSMLDLKLAMEINPNQIGGDWPLVMEKIGVRTFE